MCRAHCMYSMVFSTRGQSLCCERDGRCRLVGGWRRCFFRDDSAYGGNGDMSGVAATLLLFVVNTSKY